MKEFFLRKSIKPDKKFMITYINDDTNRKNNIFFGSEGYTDYLISKNENQRRNYINRHKKNEDWFNIYSRGFWSRFLLWGPYTDIENNIKYIEEKFLIKIHYIK